MRRTATRRVSRIPRYGTGRLPPVLPATGQAIIRGPGASRDPYANCVYQVKQNYPDSYTAQGTSDTKSAFSFTASALGNATNFANVFDQYRLDRIQMTFRPLNVATPLTNTATAGFIPGLIYVCIDYDDATAPGTVDQIRQYQNTSSHLYDTFTLDFKPHAAYTVGGSISGNVPSPWIDWATPAITHYGVKWAIPAGTAGFEQQWAITIVVWMSMRNVR